jgi:hypothetical protein
VEDLEGAAPTGVKILDGGRSLYPHAKTSSSPLKQSKNMAEFANKYQKCSSGNKLDPK